MAAHLKDSRADSRFGDDAKIKDLLEKEMIASEMLDGNLEKIEKENAGLEKEMERVESETKVKQATVKKHEVHAKMLHKEILSSKEQMETLKAKYQAAQQEAMDMKNTVEEEEAKLVALREHWDQKISTLEAQKEKMEREYEESWWVKEKRAILAQKEEYARDYAHNLQRIAQVKEKLQEATAELEAERALPWRDFVVKFAEVMLRIRSLQRQKDDNEEHILALRALIGEEEEGEEEMDLPAAHPAPAPTQPMAAERLIITKPPPPTSNVYAQGHHRNTNTKGHNVSFAELPVTRYEYSVPSSTASDNGVLDAISPHRSVEVLVPQTPTHHQTEFLAPVASPLPVVSSYAAEVIQDEVVPMMRQMERRGVEEDGASDRASMGDGADRDSLASVHPSFTDGSSRNGSVSGVGSPPPSPDRRPWIAPSNPRTPMNTPTSSILRSSEVTNSAPPALVVHQESRASPPHAGASAGPPPDASRAPQAPVMPQSNGREYHGGFSAPPGRPPYSAMQGVPQRPGLDLDSFRNLTGHPMGRGVLGHLEVPDRRMMAPPMPHQNIPSVTLSDKGAPRAQRMERGGSSSPRDTAVTSPPPDQMSLQGTPGTIASPGPRNQSREGRMEAAEMRRSESQMETDVTTPRQEEEMDVGEIGTGLLRLGADAERGGMPFQSPFQSTQDNREETESSIFDPANLFNKTTTTDADSEKSAGNGTKKKKTNLFGFPGMEEMDETESGDDTPGKARTDFMAMFGLGAPGGSSPTGSPGGGAFSLFGNASLDDSTENATQGFNFFGF